MSASTSSTSSRLAPKKPVWERSEAEKPRFIKEKDWDKFGDPGFVTGHSKVKEFLGRKKKVTEKREEIPTRRPEIVVTKLTPDLWDATVDCLVSGRKNRIYAQVFGVDEEAYRPKCRALLEEILSWPGAWAYVALNKETGQVVSTGFFCDYVDIRKMYDPESTDAEKMLTFHIMEKFENKYPDQDLSRGKLMYAFWGISRPEYAGENYMSMFGMASIKDVNEVGYHGIMIIPVAPGMYRRVQKLVEKGGVGQGFVHVFWKDLGFIFGEDSPMLKVDNPPGTYIMAYFNLYRGMQNQGSKL